MKALEYLKELRDKEGIFLPTDPLCGKDTIINPSNKSLSRWLNDGGVLINNEFPKADDEITLPITSLVFFPNGKRKTTMF